MRQAMVNANPDLAAANAKYVMRITGDNDEGKAQLDNFIDPEKRYPVIATTSKLMSTGVDAQTCKLIVLDQNIKSMTLFKQIIGRGTRLREDLGKTWFTILDFKRATDIFADKDFDGDPVQIYEPKGDEPVVPPEPPVGDVGAGPGLDGDPGFGPRPGDLPPGPGGDPAPIKRYIVGNTVNVMVARERVQYLNAQGKLITESLRDYTRINVKRQFDSLDKFLQAWSDAERKAVLIEALEAEGVLFDALADEVGKDLDPFDLLLHVAYDMPPLTRRERANRVKKRNAFAKYGEVARKVIEALIDKYADEGVQTIESIEVLRVPPLDKLGTPTELVRSFGGRPQYDAALRSLEQELYSSRP
jgi:type I restriction enzyme R subunit